MPVNDIVAQIVDGTAAGGTNEDGDAPPKNAPSGEPEPTTMQTPEMLPPYLHIDTYGHDGALALLGTVLGLVGLIEKVRK